MAADAGEGLIDAQSRIQERMDEREEERARRASHLLAEKDPERRQRAESLRLAHTELSRQLETATHKTRRDQIASALAELDRQLAALGGLV